MHSRFDAVYGHYPIEQPEARSIGQAIDQSSLVAFNLIHVSIRST